MHGNNQFHNPSSYILTFRAEGVTDAAPAKVHKVPRAAVIKIYPTSPGEATVYSTNTPQRLSDLDENSADIVASTNANWDEWGAGPVLAKTIQVCNVPVESVALVVTSGTWVLEVTGT